MSLGGCRFRKLKQIFLICCILSAMESLSKNIRLCSLLYISASSERVSWYLENSSSIALITLSISLAFNFRSNILSLRKVGIRVCISILFRRRFPVLDRSVAISIAAPSVCLLLFCNLSAVFLIASPSFLFLFPVLNFAAIGNALCTEKDFLCSFNASDDNFVYCPEFRGMCFCSSAGMARSSITRWVAW